MLSVILFRCKCPSASTTGWRVPDSRGEEKVWRVLADKTWQYGAVGHGTDVWLEPAAVEVHWSRANAQLHRAAAWPTLQARRPDEPHSHTAVASHGSRDSGRARPPFNKRARCSTLWCHQWACIWLRQLLYRVQVSQGPLFWLHCCPFIVLAKVKSKVWGTYIVRSYGLNSHEVLQNGTY